MPKKNNINYEIRPIDTSKKNTPQRKCAKDGVLPKFPFSMVICGSSGAGKTCTLINILTREEMYGKYFHTILIFSPTAGGDNSLDDTYKALGAIPDENFIKDFDPEFFETLLDARKKLIKEKGTEWVSKNSRVLLILDDVVAEQSFLKSPNALRLFTLLRHYQCAVIILTQSYTKVPRALRLNAMHTILFPSTRSECQIMQDEICPPNITKKDFQHVIDYCCGEQYSFLSYNRHAKPGERIRKNFTEVIDLEKFKSREKYNYPEYNKEKDEFKYQPITRSPKKFRKKSSQRRGDTL